MERKIFNVLNKVGVPCNIKGRLYVESAIGIVSKNGIVSATKELYPQIAKIHNTTPSCVERAIRHAIEVCFSNTDPDVLYCFFWQRN